jgi:hypothetical protein
MAVIVTFMVMVLMPFMIVLSMVVSSICRIREGLIFEGVCGTQRFTFRARNPRQQICRKNSAWGRFPAGIRDVWSQPAGSLPKLMQ